MKTQISYKYVLDEITRTYQLRYHSHLTKDEPSSTKREDMYSLASSYPPCIRALLIESSLPPSNDEDKETETDAIGSLYIIPYTGGTIGAGNKANLIDFSINSGIEPVQLTVSYDTELKSYFIQGMPSRI